ncbi:RECQ4 helicase, partial [Furnarius figulus]|nr:RECQ4 helicase [Furnarius figulus]
FACLDEAHCVSRWAHNFRPCFLRVGKVGNAGMGWGGPQSRFSLGFLQVLREQLGVRCFLALTATATAATARDVAQHLGIPEDSRILVGSSVIPENLRLSVSMEQHRDEALLSLLRREPFASMDSLLVFCTRREDTERVAALIGSHIPGKAIPGKAKAPVPAVPAAPYHAGLPGRERRRLQQQFQRGRVRVLVATAAFGLGLHKPDLRGVIHYSLPGDMEGFVQHSGRAGR